MVNPSSTHKRQSRRLRLVIVTAPRCPDCGSTELISFRSIANGDGTRTKWTRCKWCSARFVLVIE